MPNSIFRNKNEKNDCFWFKYKYNFVSLKFICKLIYMKHIGATILCLLLFQVISAQKIADAEAFFNAQDYEKAWDIYQNLLKKKPTDGLLNFKAARCLVEMKQPLEAIPYFTVAAEKKQFQSYLFLGNIFFDDYQFAKAVEAYDKYLASVVIDTDKVALLLAKAQLGADMIERVEDIEVLDSVSIPQSEILPFFRRHLDKEMGQIGTFSEIFKTSKNPNCYGFVSGRKDRIICAEPNGNQMNLQISYRLLDGWSKSTLLSEKLNSDKNENYPFVLSDGITIYFASEGHESLGGYDIFKSRFNSSTNDYLSPQNIGMPFNSPFNDYLLIIDEINNMGWFVTDRYQKEGFVVIYKFVPNSEKKILRDQEEAYVRDVARMKCFRRGQTVSLTEQSEQKEAVHHLDTIFFVVNDSVAYSDTLNFVSREACDKYLTMCKLKVLFLQKQFTLDAKREVWEIEEDETKRKALANEILSLERMLINLKRQITDYEHQARLLENAALKS